MSNKPQNTQTLVKDPVLAPVTNEELLELHATQGGLIAEMQAKIAELENEKSAAREELAALQTVQDEVIANLQGKIAELENEKAAASKAGGGVIVTIGDVQYRVVHGLLKDGAKRSPAEIAANPDLCADLLEAKSSAIQPV